MKALEQEKEEKMTLSEEEREKADAEIKKLVVKRTELLQLQADTRYFQRKSEG